MEISITATTFPEEDKELVRQALYQLITEQLSANLDLETLQMIVVPEEFGQEILLFQKKYNLKETGHTNNELGTAIAKTIRYCEDNQWADAIFVDKRLVAALFAEEGKQIAAHYIHHELGHVHDNYHKSKVFNEETIFSFNSSLTHILFCHSDIIWSEYIANRLAIGTIPHDFDFNIPFLFDLIDKTRRQTVQEIEEYRIHGDISHLFAKIQEDSSLLLRIAATVCGYLHGLSLGELDKLVNERMSQTDFKDIWRSLYEELRTLHGLYPNWKGLDQYEGLFLVILKYWNTLGIYPRMTDKGVHIDVPFLQ